MLPPKCKNPNISVEVLWCGPGLNRRHMDFQSIALPTELPHPFAKTCRIPFGVAKIRGKELIKKEI